MSIQFTNSSIFSPESGYSFYVSSNGTWAAVPFGNIYLLLNNGQQVCEVRTVEESLEYIKNYNLPKNKKILSPTYSKTKPSKKL